MTTGAVSYERETDLALLEGAFPAHIKLLEAVAESDPRHPGINLLLARLYAGYAVTVFDPALEAVHLDEPAAPQPAGRQAKGLRDRADRCYRRAAAHALEALARRHPDFSARAARIDSRDKALDAMNADDVPALFWYAFSLGRQIDLNRNDLRLVARGHLAEKAMQRVVALAPAYYNGAAHLFLMLYHVKHPAGGSGSASPVDQHYRAVCDLPDGARMAADVYYAAEVLTRRGDRDGFVALLDKVLAAGDGGARCLLDRVALRRAEGLRAAADRIFTRGIVP